MVGSIYFYTDRLFNHLKNCVEKEMIYCLPVMRQPRTPYARSLSCMSCQTFGIWTNLGLFCMCPRPSYLSRTEFHHETRGTELGKHMDRITMVLACNADGYHVFSARYIRSAKTSSLFS